MRPFKMFFGISLAVLLFFFVARFLIIAFIAAAILSIGYAIFRRVRDFITYDRYGEPYFKRYAHHPGLNSYSNSEIEPLFYGNTPSQWSTKQEVNFIPLK